VTRAGHAAGLVLVVLADVDQLDLSRLVALPHPLRPDVDLFHP
jgi:hypothetical protein